MQSLQALRTYLTTANTTLAAQPELLSVFARQGHLSCGGGASLSYNTLYTAELFITDFPGDPAAVFVPLLAWIRTHQPHLIDGDTPDGMPRTLKFEAELLNSGAVDLNIQVELIDMTIVARKPAVQGGDSALMAERWAVSHPPPPARMGELAESVTVEIVNAAGDVLATLTEPAARF